MYSRKTEIYSTKLMNWIFFVILHQTAYKTMTKVYPVMFVERNEMFYLQLYGIGIW